MEQGTAPTMPQTDDRRREKCTREWGDRTRSQREITTEWNWKLIVSGGSNQDREHPPQSLLKKRDPHIRHSNIEFHKECQQTLSHGFGAARRTGLPGAALVNRKKWNRRAFPPHEPASWMETPHAARAMFQKVFQGMVHGVETGLGISLQMPPHEGQQSPSICLPLSQAGYSRSHRFQ